MHSVLLKRPYRSEPKAHPSHHPNIFSQQKEEHLPPILPSLRSTPQSYDVVGPSSLRQKIIAEQGPPLKAMKDSLQQLENDKKSVADGTKTMMISKRDSVLSRVSKAETTRDVRNLRYYQEYLSKWEQENKRIRRATGSVDKPTLLEQARKEVSVFDNPEKQDILNHYVTSYWEMSLRNNSVILKRHLKGINRYEEHELEQLLQRDEGRKQVEASMPRLPVDQIKKLSQKELSLSGRNKLARQSQSCDPSVVSDYTSRLSRAMTDRISAANTQEMYKSHYDAAHKALKEQSFL